MNKPIYLRLEILSFSKIKMYEYWYDEVKQKFDDIIRLCYMDTDSFIMHTKTEDFYKDIAQDFEKKYDTSNYTVERPLPMGMNKKVIGMMKDELGGKIMKAFIGLRPKFYSYLTEDGKLDTKVKGTKECVIKICIMFDNYEKFLKEKNKILRKQQRFKSNGHNIYTEEINKVALSFEDDEKLIPYDGITTYPQEYYVNKNYCLKYQESVNS